MKQFIFLFSLLMGVSSGAKEVITYQGLAKTTKGEVLYIEKHTNHFEGDRIIKAVTQYLKPDLTLWAKMESDFTRSIQQPEFRFENVLSKEVHGLKYQEDKAVVWYQNAKGENKEKTLDLNNKALTKNPLVAGQGFNFDLREVLSQLKAKSELKRNFLIPSRLDYYLFVYKVSDIVNEKVTIVAKIDNTLLSFFAPKLKIIYDQKTKRLLEYQGLSNLEDEKGKAQSVIITYDYNSQDS
jgi:hypothetical protein